MAWRCSPCLPPVLVSPAGLQTLPDPLPPSPAPFWAPWAIYSHGLLHLSLSPGCWPSAHPCTELWVREPLRPPLRSDGPPQRGICWPPYLGPSGCFCSGLAQAPSRDGEAGHPGAGGFVRGRGRLYFGRRQKPVLDGTLQSHESRGARDSGSPAGLEVLLSLRVSSSQFFT